MTRKSVRTLMMGSACLLSGGLALDLPKIEKIEQNGSAGYKTVSRVAIAQKLTRSIRVTGPWLDFVTSVTASGGVSARNIQTVMFSRQVTMILDATESATRGDKSIRLNISCPPINIDCRSSILLPITVLETGPITAISPSGTVPPNAVVTFNLTGEALGVAKLLPRLLKLGNATVLSRTTTTMRVRGTTPSCGGIDVALQDEAQLDGETPFRRATSMASVKAGAWCPGDFANTTVGSSPYCPAPTTWNATALTCQ